MKRAWQIIVTQLVPTWREDDDYGRVPSNTFENKHYNEMKFNAIYQIENIRYQLMLYIFLQEVINFFAKARSV